MFRDDRQRADPHVEDECAGKASENIPVQVRLLFALRLPACDEGHLRAVPAVRQHNAGVLGSRDSRRDARHDLKVDARLVQKRRLFRAPAEDARVASFESNDGLARECLLDEDLIDLLLRERAGADPLRHVNNLGVLAGQVQQGRVGKLVGDNAIGDLEQLGPAYRDQVRPSGSGTTK